jgi:hypothetical protein
LHVNPNLLGRLLGQPIKNYPAKAFFVNTLEIRLSEQFYKAHILGDASAHLLDDILVKDIEKAVFALPTDWCVWEYGQSKMIQTTNYVKMKEATRGTNGEATGVFHDAEAKLTMKATKHKKRLVVEDFRTSCCLKALPICFLARHQCLLQTFS